MPGACASPLDKFCANSAVFRVWSGAEKGSVLRNSLTRKSDFDFLLSAERRPVTAWPDGTAGNERASEGTGRNQTINMRGRSSGG